MKKESSANTPLPLTAEFLRNRAYHLATQFGTEADIYKDLMAAANALEEKDAQKAERILGVKIQP
jgi:hypothetical protein